MISDPVLRAAARIAYMFHIDPVTVLNADMHDWNIRLAASRVISSDQSKK